MAVERTPSSEGDGDAVVALVYVVRERLLGGGFDHHGELLTSLGEADVVRPDDAASAPPALRHLDVAVDAAVEHGPGEAVAGGVSIGLLLLAPDVHYRLLPDAG